MSNREDPRDRDDPQEIQRDVDSERFDFFISCAGGDIAWAEWVAWVLKSAGYRVISKLDFHTGNDFIYEMEMAVQLYDHVLPILSQRYFTSEYTYREWTPFSHEDPQARNRLVIPVKVDPYEIRSSLNTLVHIDLVGQNDKKAARKVVLDGVRDIRAGNPIQLEEPVFPGRLIPIVSDLPKRNLATQTYEPEIDKTREVMLDSHFAILISSSTRREPQGDEANAVAAEYGHRYGSMYDVIIWGDANTEQALKRMLKEILRLLDATGPDLSNTLEIVAQVKRTLQKRKNWLLIFSQAYDPFPDAIYELFAIAKQGNGHILVTTQTLSDTTLAEVIKVHQMSAGEEALVQCLIQMKDATLKNTTQVWRLGAKGVTIGRDASNDIVLTYDDVASPRHAAVRLREGGYGLIDLNSTNHTVVNTIQICPMHPFLLRPRDEITIGKTTFLYEIGEIVCPLCHHLHRQDITVCPETGKSVRLAPFTTPPKEGYICCPYCREEHPEAKKFCSNSGKSLIPIKQLFSEADMFYYAKKHEKARDTYKQIIELNSSSIDAYLGQGRASYKLSDYDGACQAFDQVLRLEPQHYESRLWKGKVLYQIRNYKEAITTFHDLMRIDPSRTDLRRWVGRSYDKLGKYDDAVKAFNGALILEPNNADTHNRKGNALYRSRKYKEALHSYEEAIQLMEDLAIAHNGKGYAFWRLGRYPEAFSAFNMALQINPNLAEAYNGKGNILLDQGHCDEALKEFDAALQRDPDMASAHCGRYKACVGLGQIVNARKALEEAAKRGEKCQ
jgi:tetratricopeptide (TPR) repeat protein